MAPEPADWNPSKPLSNAEHEAEAQDRANAEARKDYLKGEALKKVAPEPVRRKNSPFGN